MASRVRTKATTDGTAASYKETSDSPDTRFRYDFASVQSIATSHGQNDSGLFELNFRDERYLPFEGTGAISRWRIELPKDSNAFDFNTLSDVVLRISYTAREGGQRLRQAAKASLDDLRTKIMKEASGRNPAQSGLEPALQRLFSVRHEFQKEWYAFLHAKTELTLAITSEHFPFLFRGKGIGIHRIDMFLKAKDGKALSANGMTIELSPPATEGNNSTPVFLKPPLDWKKPTWIEGSTLLHTGIETEVPWTIGDWIIRQPANAASLYKEAVDDLLLVFTYTVGK